MIHATSSRWTLGLLCAAVLLLGVGCGGGGGDDSSADTGSIQVLNNTGLDLAGVAVYQDGTRVAEIGGGLVSGGSWTFGDLEPGVYDIQAYPPGPGFVAILFYDDNVVNGGQTTNVTMTP